MASVTRPPHGATKGKPVIQDALAFLLCEVRHVRKRLSDLRMNAIVDPEGPDSGRRALQPGAGGARVG